MNVYWETASKKTEVGKFFFSKNKVFVGQITFSKITLKRNYFQVQLNKEKLEVVDILQKKRKKKVISAVKCVSYEDDYTKQFNKQSNWSWALLININLKKKKNKKWENLCEEKKFFQCF